MCLTYVWHLCPLFVSLSFFLLFFFAFFHLFVFSSFRVLVLLCGWCSSSPFFLVGSAAPLLRFFFVCSAAPLFRFSFGVQLLFCVFFCV